jgi:hypothetical protein
VGLDWLGRAALEAKGNRQLVAGAGLLAAALFATHEAASWYARYRVDADFRAGRLSRAMFLRSFQVGAFSPATEEEAARHLRERTAPDDRVLVWGLSPGIYALADRPPATRYPFHQVLLTEAPFSLQYGSLAARRDEFLEGLRGRPPVYLLVGTGDANGFEPTDSRTELMQFPELRALVEREYQQESPIGAFLVYRRTGL